MLLGLLLVFKTRYSGFLKTLGEKVKSDCYSSTAQILAPIHHLSINGTKELKFLEKHLGQEKHHMSLEYAIKRKYSKFDRHMS